MMAKRMQTIMPDLSFEESVEVTKIYSVAGILGNSIIKKRPFRNPHHTITKAGLIGGGKNPRPGEISLSHLGILFLDEFLEFKKEIIDLLREPLEEKEINISRFNISVKYPCNFLLIASLNPCPCGYYGSNIKQCVCTENERKRYISKLSGPMFDRFDMQISVFPIKYDELKEIKSEESKKIKERVTVARNMQLERYKNENINYNSELTQELIEKYCKLDSKTTEMLNQYYRTTKLSTRGYFKILKIARTISDLEQSKNIMQKHIIEALQYRKKEINE